MNQLIEKTKKNLDQVLVELKKEFLTLRANRPTPALIEDIGVNCYNQRFLLKQLCSISVNPPRELLLHVWDKQVVNAIINALESSEMGFSVKNDNNVIRVYLPELSQERRQEIIKKAKKIAEEYRIKVRNLRDEVNKEIKKIFENHEISEDLMFKLKEEVQKEIDSVNKKIEEILEKKVEELSN